MINLMNDLSFTNGKIIQGKNIANAVNRITREKAEQFKEQYGVNPKYVVIMVGDNKSSARYVSNKKATSEKYGVECIVDLQPDSITQDRLIDLVIKYNLDISIHGIIVQLPLPKHIDPMTVINTIDPRKDVDGFHPLNSGYLNIGSPIDGRIPCTALGICVMLKSLNVELEGKNVLIIGRSNIVGRPLRSLLEQENCTVFNAHSKTNESDLRHLCKFADIIISAVGKIGFIQDNLIDSHQVIIDVGTTVDEYGKLKGDVALSEDKIKTSRYISPVPGGVGPMTIAMLLHNVVTTAHDIGGPRLMK